MPSGTENVKEEILVLVTIMEATANDAPLTANSSAGN